jgi:hypothetical protein
MRERGNQSSPRLVATEGELAFIAASLACPKHLISAERKLVNGQVDSDLIDTFRALIGAGEDPLGECFVAIRSPETRRDSGAVYTPSPIVRAMISWAAKTKVPARVVDPGAGSGRFILAAAQAFPNAQLVACDIDPLATLMLKANAAVLNLTHRLQVHLTQFRLLELPTVDGPTLYIGNPPFVRHHKIGDAEKRWFACTAARLGFKASKLAGLHIHFFLRTREISRPGDFGCFITAAEWMDVNYGSVLRDMLADGLGGTALQVFSPTGVPFANAMTTGAITCFQVGRRAREFTVRELSSLDELSDLSLGRPVPWEVVRLEKRWSRIVRPASEKPDDMVPLGELFRVHRGSVTGNNSVFLEGSYKGPLPRRFLVPAVTKARDLINAGLALNGLDGLRRVISLPVELSSLAQHEREQIERFLAWAKGHGAHLSYTARFRRAWWSVSLREPAPIICTYMGRRPPVFVRNLVRARHINIAHGLYPKVQLSASQLDAYASYLTATACVSDGRTYAGGLTKFEPKEIEQILVPCLNRIHDAISANQKMDAGRASGRFEASPDHLQRSASQRNP